MSNRTRIKSTFKAPHVSQRRTVGGPFFVFVLYRTRFIGGRGL